MAYARAKVAARKAKRIDRIADNLVLSVKGTQSGISKRATGKTRAIKSYGRKQLIKRLDAAFSLLIRLRTQKEIGHCAFCPKPIEHCFHFITRAKYSIRWDAMNAIGSCAGCNYRNEFDPSPFIYYFIKRWGQQALGVLIRDGNKISKLSNDDLKALFSDMQCDMLRHD